MKRVILSGLLAVLLCTPVLAGPNYNVCFYSMDADSDGNVSKEEFRTAFAQGDEVFKAADADGDGVLGHEEWESYKESQGYEDAHEG